VEESSRTTNVLENTLSLIRDLEESATLMVQTPIIFTEDYSELVDPVGILATIKQVGAFKAGSSGASVIEPFIALGDRLMTVPGKRGLNAFSNTELGTILQSHGVEDIVLAGTVTSICIDSTGRSAFEQGFRVHVLSDCTSARTNVEQDFYCENIFPLYARVITSSELRSAMAM
jgi:nicotinamidase-related amidase